LWGRTKNKAEIGIAERCVRKQGMDTEKGAERGEKVPRREKNTFVKG